MSSEPSNSLSLAFFFWVEDFFTKFQEAQMSLVLCHVSHMGGAGVLSWRDYE